MYNHSLHVYLSRQLGAVTVEQFLAASLPVLHVSPGQSSLAASSSSGGGGGGVNASFSLSVSDSQSQASSSAPLRQHTSGVTAGGVGSSSSSLTKAQFLFMRNFLKYY
jgi:hypothetical protein